VNADTIAQGLAGFRADEAAIMAGRVMLDRLDELASKRVDFAFETTLSGRTVRRLLSQFVRTGYAVRLLYLWLPTPDLAVARVRLRVRHGGHDVPEDVIRRRFERSLHNFWFLYRPLATTWQVFDASSADVRTIVARGAGSDTPTVIDADRWNRLLEQVNRSDISGGRERERP